MPPITDLPTPWTSLIGLTRVTITPNGGPNGDGVGMFGANTAGTTTNGWLEGITYAATMGAVAHITGTFSQAATAQLSSSQAGVHIEMVNCSVTDTGTGNGLIWGNGTNNLSIETWGCTFTGQGGTVNVGAFKLLNCADFVIEHNSTTFASYRPTGSAGFHTITGTSGGVIRGDWRTGDSKAIFSSASGDIDCSGFRTIQGGYTTTRNSSAVVQFNSGGGAAGSIYVHDMNIDGGSQVAANGVGIIDIDGAGGSFNVVHVAHIRLANLGNGALASNTYQDGLDLNLGTRCIVHDITVEGGNDASAITNFTDVAVTNFIARNCRFSGIQIGDPVLQTGTTQTANVTNCTADNCAAASGNFGAFAVYTNTAGVVASANFESCWVYNSAAATGYGLNIVNSGASGTIGTVKWSGGSLQGVQTAPVHLSAGSGTIGTVYVVGALGMVFTANVVQVLHMAGISVSPSNPTGTTVTAGYTNAGLSNPASVATVVPLVFPLTSGRVKVTLSGQAGNTTAADSMNIRPVWAQLAAVAQNLGAWSSTVAYVVNNVVLSGTTYYICILGNTNNVPPNATFWTALAPPANGGGPSGTVVGIGFSCAAGANQNQGFTFNFEVNMTPGSCNYVDIQQEAVTGGTGNLKNLYVTIDEIDSL